MLQYLPQIHKSRLIPILALVCPLLLNQASAFAASKLAKIEFKPTSTITNIQLHSDSILPYHIAFSSDDKLMIDLDNVTNDGTIDTQFEGISETSVISNVVLQPLNDHSLRIIVRGEHLAPPHIGFSPIHQDNTAANTTVNNANSPLIPESVGEDLPVDTGLSSAKPVDINAPIIHQAPNKPNINQVGMAKDLDILPPSHELDVRRPESQNNAAFASALLSSVTTIPIMGWAPYGVAAILLVGLGIFLYKKLKALGMRSPVSYDILLEQQAQGQPIGFRQLANAYRQENPEMASEQAPVYQEPVHQKPLQQESLQNDRLKGDSLIGLGRLSQLIDSMAQNPSSSQQPSIQPQQKAQKVTQQRIEQSLKPAQTSLPKAPSRQATQQYAQSERQSHLAKAKQKVTNSTQNLQQHPIDKELLRQELQRANEVQQETRQRLQSQANAQNLSKNQSNQPLHRQSIQQRQAISAKQPKGANTNKAPLTGNPEVLDFLKSVADLMEKDGRSNMAQSFRSKAKPE